MSHLYAIANTIDEGLNSRFSAGPFPEFPKDDFEAGCFIFRIDGDSAPQLALDEMREHRAGAGVEADLVYQQACAATNAPGVYSGLEDRLGYKLNDLMEEFLGRFDIAEVFRGALSQSSPIDPDQIVRMICSVDETLLAYAHEIRYEPSRHKEAAEEFAAWTLVRQSIWQRFGQRQAATQTHASVENTVPAPSAPVQRPVSAQATDAPRPASGPTPVFRFSRPRG